MNENWQDYPDSSFGERDLNVLNLIDEEDLDNFTFDGLKRRLGVHPETLSRILCRLENQGFVEKQSLGYRVSPKGKRFMASNHMAVGESRIPVLQTLLSPDVPIQRIISDLSGRWFGMLRWLGSSENVESVTLKWITEEGGVQVDAVFSGNNLSIQAKLLHEKNLNSALRACYQLIGYIAKFYGGRNRASSVAYFGDFKPYPIFT